MKFLIDECLHTSLVTVAQARDHEANHVSWLGLSGTTDWDLMPRIIEGDFVFVTNNAQDFRRLYRAEGLHAGLVIIIPQRPPAEQRQLFDTALDEIGSDPNALINEALELDLEGDEVVLQRYGHPDDTEVAQKPDLDQAPD